MATPNKTVKGLLGKKLGMTQVWDENNRLIPVTVVEAGSNVVTQIKNAETDGYSAIQVAYGAIDPRKVTKPVTGHFEKAGVNPRRYIAEIRTADADTYAVGQELGVEVLEVGAKVDVVGTSKGKGFAGHMKRPLCWCKCISRCSPQPPQAWFDRYVVDPGSRLQR